MGSGAEIFNSVINQGGTPAMLSNTLSLRPAFGYRGRIFIATDTREIYRDTGTSWELIGSGAVSSVNIYNSDGTLTGNRAVTAGINTLQFIWNINSERYLTVRNLTNGNATIGGFLGFANGSQSVAYYKTGTSFGTFQGVSNNDGVLQNTGGKLNILSDGPIEIGINGISTVRN